MTDHCATCGGPDPGESRCRWCRKEQPVTPATRALRESRDNKIAVDLAFAAQSRAMQMQNEFRDALAPKIVLAMPKRRWRDQPWELWWRFIGWPIQRRRMGWPR